MKKIFFLFILMLLPLMARAYDAFIDGIYYNISPTKAEVTASVIDLTDRSNAKAYFGDVTIPSQVTFCNVTYNVTSISSSAFRDCDGLTSVTIPSTITSIGNNAFYNCINLSSITIPNSVNSVGSNAFYGTAWYDSQPNGLVYAGHVLYKYKGTMPDNSSVVIKEGTISIAEEAFYECTGLIAVTIPNSVTSISDWAFQGCTGLTSINIPNSVTQIGNAAFHYCSKLSSIEIPNSVISIGEVAFDLTPWYASQPNGLVYVGQVLYSYKGAMPDNTSLIIKEGTKGIAGAAFSRCSGLTSIEIPNSVSNIGKYAFNGCCGLTSVNIPNSVAEIGLGAFSHCTNLVSVEIPNGTVKIGGSAFAYCNNLTSIKISESVSSIGVSFWGCTSLNSIVIDPRNPYYDSRENCNAIIQTGTNSLIVGCNGTIIPSTVTSIKRLAFNEMGIKSITIPENIIKIGDCAFSGCSELREVLFSGNSQIKKLEESTFAGCRMRNIMIPEGVLSIGNQCFSNCHDLQSVYIPNSVDSIGYYAFGGCPGLQMINTNSLESWCNIIFDMGSNPLVYTHSLYLNGNLLTNLVIPNNVKEIKQDTFQECFSITSLIISEGIVSIGPSAFSGCENLSIVALPKSLAFIDRYAFDFWTSLKDLFCYAEEIPINNSPERTGLFYKTPIENATLHVPESSLEIYKQTAPWNRFGNIVALTDADPKPTNIYPIANYSSNRSVKSFSIDGRQFSSPQRGLNILHVSDGTIKKVMMK